MLKIISFTIAIYILAEYLLGSAFVSIIIVVTPALLVLISSKKLKSNTICINRFSNLSSSNSSDSITVKGAILKELNLTNSINSKQTKITMGDLRRILKSHGLNNTKIVIKKVKDNTYPFAYEFTTLKRFIFTNLLTRNRNILYVLRKGNDLYVDDRSLLYLLKLNEMKKEVIDYQIDKPPYEGTLSFTAKAFVIFTSIALLFVTPYNSVEMSNNTVTIVIKLIALINIAKLYQTSQTLINASNNMEYGDNSVSNSIHKLKHKHEKQIEEDINSGKLETRRSRYNNTFVFNVFLIVIFISVNALLASFSNDKTDIEFIVTINICLGVIIIPMIIMNNKNPREIEYNQTYEIEKHSLLPMYETLVAQGLNIEESNYDEIAGDQYYTKLLFLVNDYTGSAIFWLIPNFLMLFVYFEMFGGEIE